MKKQINEIHRMQQLAGIKSLNELGINKPSPRLNHTQQMLNDYILYGYGQGDQGLYDDGDMVRYEYTKEDSIDDEREDEYDEMYNYLKNEGGKWINDIKNIPVTYKITPNSIVCSYIWNQEAIDRL